VHIPKGDGTETRPIGIPTFEDKVLQRAVAMVIGEVYEQEFHDFSYGFRPGCSAHQALRAVQNAAWRMGGGWIVEVDRAQPNPRRFHGSTTSLCSGHPQGVTNLQESALGVPPRGGTPCLQAVVGQLTTIP
jgi:hypothetical protein